MWGGRVKLLRDLSGVLGEISHVDSDLTWYGDWRERVSAIAVLCG